MNNTNYGAEATLAAHSDQYSGQDFSGSTDHESGFRQTACEESLSEADKGYLATCEESYNITRQTLALYALYPDSLYAI